MNDAQRDELNKALEPVSLSTWIAGAGDAIASICESHGVEVLVDIDPLIYGKSGRLVVPTSVGRSLVITWIQAGGAYAAYRLRVSMQ